MEKIRIHDIVFFAINIILSGLLIKFLGYFIFQMDQEAVQKFWIPNLSYWKIAAGLLVLFLMHLMCIRCWKYKESGFLTKIGFWAFMVQNSLVFMLIFFFLIMAVLILFFNAPNYQNPLPNCKGMALFCGAVFTVSAIGQSYKHYKDSKKN